MSILNALGLGKTLDTSLGTECSEEAKSSPGYVKNISLGPYAHSKSTSHIKEARCAAQMLNALILHVFCSCCVHIQHNVCGKHQTLATGIWKTKLLLVKVTSIAHRAPCFLAQNVSLGIVNPARPAGGSHPSNTVKLCSA